MSVGDWLIFAGFACLSIVMAVQDIRTLKVSRALSLLLLILEFVASLFGAAGNRAVIEVLVSTAVALLVFMLVRLLSGRLEDGRRKLGLADVFYSGSMGAYLGFIGWLEGCVLACILALIVSAVNVFWAQKESQDRERPEFEATFARHQARSKPVPFVACLAAGALAIKLIEAIR